MTCKDLRSTTHTVYIQSQRSRPYLQHITNMFPGLQIHSLVL